MFASAMIRRHFTLIIREGGGAAISQRHHSDDLKPDCSMEIKEVQYPGAGSSTPGAPQSAPLQLLADADAETSPWEIQVTDGAGEVWELCADNEHDYNLWASRLHTLTSEDWDQPAASHVTVVCEGWMARKKNHPSVLTTSLWIRRCR